MRPLVHAALGAALAVGGVITVASVPGLAQENVTVSQEGWAWRLEDERAPSLSPLSGIQEDQLPVSWTAQPDKVAYIGVVLPPSSGAAPVSRLDLSLGIDPEAQNLNVDQAHLIACVVTGTWEPGAPMAWQDRPQDDCGGTAVPGILEVEANRFYFDLTPLVSDLAAAEAHGLVIAPDPEAGATSYQVVFRSALRDGATFAYDASPAPPDPPPSAPPPQASVTPSPSPTAAVEPLPTFAPAPPPRQPGPAPELAAPLVAEPSPGVQPRPSGPETTVSAAAPETSDTRTVSLSGVYLALAGVGSLGLMGRAGGAVLELIRSREEFL
ncbi:MAG: hypothetical protein KY469_14605 [Actinobacteria bacterium]|nr:hypothetical protein [Actinomycetota bacterium]